jgi:hypothetical protein
MERGIIMGKKFGVSFSYKRALGVSGAKNRISRKIGIPLTKSGRRQKIGRATGCLLPIIIFTILLSICGYALAHPGRTDGNGGHYDRKTGTYHYHNSGSSTGSSSSDTSSTNNKSTDNMNNNNSASESKTIQTISLPAEKSPKNISFIPTVGFIQVYNTKSFGIEIMGEALLPGHEVIGGGGIFIVGNASGYIPNGTLSYPCPHDSWYYLEPYKTPEFGFYVKTSYKIANSVYVTGSIGTSVETTTYIQKSLVTGWTYKKKEETTTYYMYGAGLMYFPSEGFVLSVEYNNRRGIIVGFSKPIEFKPLWQNK